ncbi:hypothetical protein ElyMa_007044600 [Elysia marginata]|uniref:Uncharacterized protein n=1 Tax=Elysia marginata TaxID=1093978 RepID=A0AAV4JTM5_9GAST|nr:hypothetical protein ElyMa_007044600 [Elysia marginata]
MKSGHVDTTLQNKILIRKIKDEAIREILSDAYEKCTAVVVAVVVVVIVVVVAVVVVVVVVVVVIIVAVVAEVVVV